jgi:hypothetical protein
MQPDELTPLERHLAACRPTTTGLDTDAMLFAAGRAAAKPGPARYVWPALACGFAVLSVVLGGGMMHERSERLALAQGVNPHSSLEAPVFVPAVAPSPELAPDSYLAARRLVERDADAWPPRRDATPGTGAESPPPAPVFRAWGTAIEP